MPTPTEQPVATFQQHFHQRWNILKDPHVRTLAWLLDAPDLLDPDAPEWHGRIASIEPVDETTRAWLMALDRMPEQLHAYLGIQPFTRLGRYSEKLMAFYLEHRQLLFAHGVQVTAGNATIGEFDFLLRRGDALVHWEFATKLYLLESSGHGHQADYFVGPNLADTLGAKVRKIMDRQLSLSLHPAAQVHLPNSVVAAQALVKGWLFYQGQTPPPAQPRGILPTHCRGFWRTLEEVERLPALHYIVLPRLSWLAPAKIALDDSIGKTELKTRLNAHFNSNSTPALIALLEPVGGCLLEIDRGFIVPDDWRRRAEMRIKGLF